MDNEDSEDYIIPGPKLSNNTVPCIRHKADNSLELGTLMPIKDGESISGEILNLTPREKGGFGVEVLYNARGNGPPSVTSKAYRNGWDSTFKKSKSSSLN